uniref:Uncharacterized protein LOC107422559 n=1 Tax=Rhizophora mucronata TaxID=61149 RepID=A0A2P2J4F7_RHIMU
MEFTGFVAWVERAMLLISGKSRFEKRTSIGLSSTSILRSFLLVLPSRPTLAPLKTLEGVKLMLQIVRLCTFLSHLFARYILAKCLLNCKRVLIYLPWIHGEQVILMLLCNWMARL